MSQRRRLHNLTRRKAHPKRRLRLEELEPRHLLSVTFQPPIIANNAPPTTSPPFSPAQIRTAYGFSNVSFGTTPADGRGQTIAIVDAYDDPNIKSDLAVFDSTFGLPPPPSFKVVNQTGGSTLPMPDPTGGDWAGEISLDVEWAHAIAPGANILLVEANAATDSSLFGAVTYARQVPGVSVVSMSWGTIDSFADLQLAQTLTPQVLVTPAGHQGVTFVASTGDESITGFPATSPNVLAVGGTSLSLNSNNGYSSESAWGSLTSFEGSGGGISQIFFGRSTPDVSYDADPNTGFNVYDTFPSPDFFPTPGWNVVGGTSAGAPQWSALLAIANQGRALAGLGTLNGPTQTIPAIYAAPATDFHDVTTGTTLFFAAAPGYDLATGRGTPIANQLIPYLVSIGASSAAAPPASSSSSPGNFAGTAASSSQIALSWTAAPGALGYDLYELQNGQPVRVATYAAGTTSATIGGLAAGSTYAFNLVAFKTGGTSATPWIQVTTLAAPAAAIPSPPGNFAGSAPSASEIDLTWSASTGALGYDLYEIENGQPVRIATYGAGTTSATVAGLAAGTKYAFNLVAFNNAGTAATPWLAVSTLAGSVGLSPPAPPGKFAGAAITTTQIRLNWTISPTAIGYDLYEIISRASWASAQYPRCARFLSAPT